MIRLLRHLVFYLGNFMVLILITTSMVFLFFMPFRFRFHYAALWPQFSIWWLRVTCGVAYQIEGMENIPATPVIIMSNHQSTWETMAMQGLFPPLAWILKRELMWVPFFGWAAAMLKPIFIDRSKGREAREQLLSKGAKRLQEGIHVAVFPEGTRVPVGTYEKFKPGGALLAAKSGVPVVPVAHNAGYFWPRRGFFKKPGTIRMVIGKPFTTQGMKASEINRKVEQWIEQTRKEIGAPDPGC